MKKILMAVMVVFVFAMAGCGGDDTLPAEFSYNAADAILNITPADGTTGVPVTSAVTVTFSKDIDPDTLNVVSVTLMRSVGMVSVPGAVTYDVPNRTLTFTPKFPMQAGAQYTFTIGAGAQQIKAEGDHSITFTTQTSQMLFASSSDINTKPIDIWSMNEDGANQKNLTNFTDKNVATAISLVASWSPDYTQIAFLVRSDVNDNTNLYVMNADGSGIKNLTNGGTKYKIQVFKWAPDGSKIFFIFTPDASNIYNIGSVNPDGSGLANLTNLSGVVELLDYYRLSLSPDGTKIVYATGDPTDPLAVPRDIYIINSDGTNNTKLTSSAVGNSAIYPIFSADGSKIYYTYGSGATGLGLVSMNLDGSGPQTIVAPVAGKSIMPWSFSPDGTKLVAITIVSPFTADAYIISADGATVTRLTTASLPNTGWLGSWSWSPDGSKVAYLYGDVDNGPLDLFIANSDGSGQINLTNFTGDTLVFNYFEIFLTLGSGIGQWSVDGTQFVFTKMVKSSNYFNVVAAKTDGSGVSEVFSLAPLQMAAFAVWW